WYWSRSGLRLSFSRGGGASSPHAEKQTIGTIRNTVAFIKFSPCLGKTPSDAGDRQPPTVYLPKDNKIRAASSPSRGGGRFDFFPGGVPPCSSGRYAFCGS